jgi:hypothetical protein
MPKPEPQAPKKPIGDPPPPKKPFKVDRSMMDPFTEQVTGPAGDGQGASSPPRKEGVRGENEEDAMAVEQGFSPIP